MDFRDRIHAWNHTQSFLATDPLAMMFSTPKTTKVKFDEKEYATRAWAPANAPAMPSTNAEVMVENEDCLVVAERLLGRGLTPMVLVLADDRFAGGDVRLGSGAQEENLFRRTNLCVTMKQSNDFYPIREDEALVSQNVTVFKASEKDGCKMLRKPFQVDFIACPALHNPQLTEDGLIRTEDEAVLRNKLRLIFQQARVRSKDSLVLGPMGCGAWRNPPAQVARIMYEEIQNVKNAFKVITVACLEVDPKSYIVVHRDKPSNFEAFRKAFEQRT